MSETVEQGARRLFAPKIARGYVPRALHAYVNADGQPIYWRARLEHPDGDAAPDGRKIIRPLHLNGNGYKIGEPDFPNGKKPLYNLDKLAADDTAPVFIVEGEKAADALTKRGAIATTSGAADSAARADWSALAKRDCILWADNDDAGRAYMGDVAAILETLGCKLSAMDIDALSLPAKGDAFDWLADRPESTLGDLLALPRVQARQAAPDATAADCEPAMVRLVRGDAIKLQPVAWLWDGCLARGKVHLIAGAPGTGKTTLAMAFAATITQRGRWPDGSRAEAGDVLIWSGEDAAGDTLMPRLLAMGADPSRVHFVSDVREGSEANTFDPAKHFPALALAAAKLPGLRLMIVDPIVSAVAGDSHHNAEVRRGLAPLVAFAEASGCALIGITHFAKGTQGREPLERVAGSLGFGAVARIVFGTAKLPDDKGGGRALVRVKSNLGKDGGGFRYDIRPVSLDATHAGIETTRIEWGDPIEGTAREILADAEAPDTGAGNPKDFLRELLSAGPMRSADVFKDAAANGYSKQQMYRAKDALGIIANKIGMKEGWRWHLPGRAEDIASGREDIEDIGPQGPTPSASSAPSSPETGRRWCITRPSGETFTTTTAQPTTVADMQYQHPGAKVKQLDEAAAGQVPHRMDA